MKRIIILMSLLLMITLQAQAIDFNENKKIENIFKSEDINGTFVVYDSEKDSFIGYNQERGQEQFTPASTFKIFNSLIGLSTGAVNNVDETFYYYDGSKVFLKSWEDDMNLRTAIKISHVPAYKQLAREIGLENMQKNISKLQFGNEQIGSTVDTFWLEGPLKISAVEQAELLSKLASKSLPYPREVQDTVCEITLLDSGDKWELHGKTGWLTANSDPSIGWFVGWIEEDGKVYSFAINMDLDDAEDLPKRQEIAIKSLKAIGLLSK